ncbi:DgyrCDS13761 [Dimorphilus gyrociliatus]|uniref:DgyrCDS13761 n=1 Tax=Dimorphilus gyrociliatus TaxID=2664684 RepID=A0A7I8WBQ5_9ANNE|nr:DgyrCDS13761 [Dimorphilus gyrociliatus]
MSSNSGQIENFKLVRADIQDRFISVTWSSGSKSLFPCVWLRDNCQSQDCFHPSTKSRLLTLDNIDTDEIPTNVKINCNNELEIVWKNNHVSLYKAEWLDKRRFEEDARKKRLTWLGTDMELWGSEMKNKVPVQQFQKILDDDNELYLWLRHLEKYGLVLIKDAPREVGQLNKLGQRVFFLRKTHYGETFQVKVKADPNNAAYTTGILNLHIDQCYYDYTPGVQMLHCIENEAEGGESEFCDGFHVVNQLKERFAEYFNILKSVDLDFMDIGTENNRKFHKIHRCPTICTNHKGEILKIMFNNAIRDSHIDCDAETALKIYESLKVFHKLLNDERNKISFKLKPGEIVCFHNFRVLHGRKAFKSNRNRHLEGAYIDWDEIHDKMRVLRSELNN